MTANFYKTFQFFRVLEQTLQELADLLLAARDIDEVLVRPKNCVTLLEHGLSKLLAHEGLELAQRESRDTQHVGRDRGGLRPWDPVVGLWALLLLVRVLKNAGFFVVVAILLRLARVTLFHREVLLVYLVFGEIFYKFSEGKVEQVWVLLGVQKLLRQFLLFYLRLDSRLLGCFFLVDLFKLLFDVLITED